MIFVTKLRRKQIWSLNIFGMNIKSVERETVKSLISKIIIKRLSGDMNNLYDLIAVNMHFSLGGINSGHYVSIIKHNDKWILYNDENPIQEVNNPQFKEAYILFYKLK